MMGLVGVLLLTGVVELVGIVRAVVLKLHFKSSPQVYPVSQSPQVLAVKLHSLHPVTVQV